MTTSTTTTATKQIPIVCPGHTRPLAELQFCEADNRVFLLSACHDRMPMIRDGISGDWIGTCIGHKGAVWCCRMDTATGCFIATASGDFSVKIFDAITGQCIWTFIDAKHIMKSCDFTPINTTHLATAGHEGIVRIYNLIEQEKLYTKYQKSIKGNNSKGDTNNNKSQQCPNVTPVEIVVQPILTATTNNSNTKITIGKLNWYNDSILIIGCSDGIIRWYDTTRTSNMNEPIHVIHTDDHTEIRDMELKTITIQSTNQQQRWLSFCAGKTVYIYNVTDIITTSSSDNIQLVHQFTLPKIHFRDEGGVSVHPTGTKCIVGGSDLYVYIYSLIASNDNNNNSIQQYQEIECCKGHHGPIRCLRYSPDGTTFASGSEDGTIRLWQGDNK